MDRPRLDLTGVVLDTPDPDAPARFYQDLLGWTRHTDEPDRVTLHDPRGGAGLSFQREEHHVPPVWPAGPGDPRMQVHLDIEVDDLDAASAHAVALGAVVAGFQPQDDVRVHLDPAGHPFCLFL
jgi:catechol 2,3-dioxygenase-like lactoylglutathione lyase family enzyme